MLKTLVIFFLQVALYTSLVSGLYNGLLFYAKSYTHFHTQQPLKGFKRVLAAVVFGCSSALATFAFIIVVAALTYPIFEPYLMKL